MKGYIIYFPLSLVVCRLSLETTTFTELECDLESLLHRLGDTAGRLGDTAGSLGDTAGRLGECR